MVLTMYAKMPMTCNPLPGSSIGSSKIITCDANQAIVAIYSSNDCSGEPVRSTDYLTIGCNPNEGLSTQIYALPEDMTMPDPDCDCDTAGSGDGETSGATKTTAILTAFAVLYTAVMV